MKNVIKSVVAAIVAVSATVASADLNSSAARNAGDALSATFNTDTSADDRLDRLARSVTQHRKLPTGFTIETRDNGTYAIVIQTQYTDAGITYDGDFHFSTHYAAANRSVLEANAQVIFDEAVDHHWGAQAGPAIEFTMNEINRLESVHNAVANNVRPSQSNPNRVSVALTKADGRGINSGFDVSVPVSVFADEVNEVLADRAEERRIAAEEAARVAAVESVISVLEARENDSNRAKAIAVLTNQGENSPNTLRVRVVTSSGTEGTIGFPLGDVHWTAVHADVSAYVADLIEQRHLAAATATVESHASSIQAAQAAIQAQLEAAQAAVEAAQAAAEEIRIAAEEAAAERLENARGTANYIVSEFMNLFGSVSVAYENGRVVSTNASGQVTSVEVRGYNDIEAAIELINTEDLIGQVLAEREAARVAAEEARIAAEEAEAARVAAEAEAAQAALDARVAELSGSSFGELRAMLADMGYNRPFQAAVAVGTADDIRATEAGAARLPLWALTVALVEAQ